MTHILIVEDDAMISGPVARSMRGAGYEVTTAADGKAGLKAALEGKPDLVILDIMLPEMDGWEVCKAIRQESVVPILMLTALSEEFDRVLGLELGADDYLTKPFSMRELLARVKAMLRRVEMDQQSRGDRVLTVKGITLDRDARTVHKGGEPLTLRYKEFELLTLLMLHAGEVVSRDEIFNAVWDTEWYGDMHTLNVHISWLREKIEDDPSSPEYIQTVRGVGYRFTNP